MGKSVALKCTYNDGHENPRDRGVFVGFSGTCSDDTIEYNVWQGRAWCSHEQCPCRQFYARGMKGERPVDPCMESRLFRKWEFGAGWWHHGEKAGTPKHMRQVQSGEFAVLTTRYPYTQESERRIIGLYQIGKVLYQGSLKQDTTLAAAEVGRVRLRIAEADSLYFWAYHRNKNASHGIPEWGTGLVRYLDNAQVHRILVDVAAVLRDSAQKSETENLIMRVFGRVPAPPATGYLAHKSKELK
jgi:hypothetical protein